MSSDQDTSPVTALEQKLGEDGLDMAAFGQILEMDDPGEHEFSNSIMSGFLEQAEQTLSKLDKSLEEKNLEELSGLGHFLKGSSATLGLLKIRDGCEKIQCYGKHEDTEGNAVNDDEALKQIKEAIKTVREDYATAKSALEAFLQSQGHEA